MKATIDLALEVADADLETEALHRSLRDLAMEFFSLTMRAPKEAVEGLAVTTTGGDIFVLDR